MEDHNTIVNILAPPLTHTPKPNVVNSLGATINLQEIQKTEKAC